MDISSQASSFQTNNMSLLKSSTVQRRSGLFWSRKQEKQEVKQEHNVSKMSEKRPKVIIQKGLPEHTNSTLPTQYPLPTSSRPFSNNFSSSNKLDQSQRIEFYSIIGEIKQIEDRSKKLKKSMSSFVCWATVILLLVMMAFIVMLKSFLFFNTQLVGTIVESFKDQLFDPKVTNDQLQLEVFYVEQGFFILAVILLILFILTFTLMVSRHYQHRLRKYKLHKMQVRHLQHRREILLDRIKSFAIQFNTHQ